MIIPGAVRRVGRSAAVVAVLLAFLAAGCGRVPTTGPYAASPAASEPADTSAPADAASGGPGTGACEYTPTGEAARPVQPPSTTGVPESGTATAKIALSGGTVTVTLDQLRSPCTVHSFVSLARQGYFNGTRCHRLVDAGMFILQCGDPSASGRGGPGYSYADETDGTESYTEGVVAMANSGPNTNGSQFFLVYRDSTALDATPNYTIFGRMDAASIGVVAGIGDQGRDDADRPIAPADIATVTVS